MTIDDNITFETRVSRGCRVSQRLGATNMIPPVPAMQAKIDNYCIMVAFLCKLRINMYENKSKW